MHAPLQKFRRAATRALLSAGKLHFTLGFSRHAVARRRTISPCAHGLQNAPVSRHSRALKNQRAMHPPICADDEADSDFAAIRCSREEGIRRSQRLWRFYRRACRTRADMRNVYVLRRPPQRSRDLPLALFQNRRMSAPARSVPTRQCGKNYQQDRGPDATTHGSSPSP
jgi:hypothetical protein